MMAVRCSADEMMVVRATCCRHYAVRDDAACGDGRSLPSGGERRLRRACGIGRRMHTIEDEKTGERGCTCCVERELFLRVCRSLS